MAMSGLPDIKPSGPETTKMVLAGFVSALVMSYIFSHFVDLGGATTIGAGAQLGFWIWLGFVATIQAGVVLWEKKPIKLFLINSSFYLVTLVSMGAVLAIWQ
jgi:hypothetical protein